MSSEGSAGAISLVSTAVQVAATSPPAVSASVPLAAGLLSAEGTAVNSPLPVPLTGIVIFKAKGDSWVEVTDAKGTVVLRRTLGPGEVAGASGVLPLAAVVGRADATEVKVRGKEFDLATFAKDNVARFEVK